MVGVAEGEVRVGMENTVDRKWWRSAGGQVRRLQRRAQKVLASVSGEWKSVLLYPTAQWSISRQVNEILNQGTEASNGGDMEVNGVITGLEVVERNIQSS